MKISNLLAGILLLSATLVCAAPPEVTESFLQYWGNKGTTGTASSADEILLKQGDAVKRSSPNVLRPVMKNNTTAWGLVTSKPTTFPPAAHTQAATTITDDTTHRFVTDTEKSTWSGKQDLLVNSSSLGKISESEGLPTWDGGAWPGGTTIHNNLTGRDAADSHPIGAVTGLQGALDGKLGVSASASYFNLSSAGNAATRDVGTTAGTVAAGDDSRIINSAQSSYFTNYATGMQTWMPGTSTSTEQFTASSRSGISIPVPFLTPAITNKQIAFDVFPKGSPSDFTSTTGVAWQDICSNDIAADGTNYSCLRSAALQNSDALLGPAKGGTGTLGNLYLSFSGNKTRVGSTTAPTYMLDVSGDINIPTGSNYKINGVNISSATPNSIAAGDTSIEITDTGDGYTVFKEDGTEYMRLTGGKLGVGIDAPATKLHVFSTSNPMIIELSGSATNAFNTVGSAVYRTDGTAADGLGPRYSFYNYNAGGYKLLGGLGFIRAGADNTGTFILQNSVVGVVSETMRVLPTGFAGIGDFSAANPTSKLQVKEGHIATPQTTAPTATCNGAAATVPAGSTDHRGSFGNTQSATTSCVLTFNIAYAAAPVCVANLDSASGRKPVYMSSSTTAAATFTFDSVNNPSIQYICF